VRAGVFVSVFGKILMLDPAPARDFEKFTCPARDFEIFYLPARLVPVGLKILAAFPVPV
jgi:hypothetical protein